MSKIAFKSTNDESFPVEFMEKLLKSDKPLSVWREYRNLTQKRLAEKSGISQSFITQIENGKKIGSAKTLQALAVALGCDIEDILPRQSGMSDRRPSAINGL